jgi:hypothetical protein
MRALIFILILLSFFQATFLPINLVFLVLILRAYIRVDKSNFYLAFGFGLLISLLLQNNLGIHSLIYLVGVLVAHLTTKLPFSKHILTVIPLSLVLLLLNYGLIALLTRQLFIPINSLVIETILSLPIYIVLRVWEERFVIRPDIKLKI